MKNHFPNEAAYEDALVEHLAQLLVAEYRKSQRGQPLEAASVPHPPRHRLDVCGCYLVRLGEMLKIGRSGDVKVRITNHGVRQKRQSTSELIAVIVCDSIESSKQLEKELLLEFDTLRVARREWFRFDQAIVDRFRSHPNFLSPANVHD